MGPQTHYMAAMLYGRYGAQVAHVTLHALCGDCGHGPALEQLVEDCIKSRPNPRVAFLVAGSPFAALRDSRGYFFRRQSARRLAAVVGYRSARRSMPAGENRTTGR